MYNLGIFLGTEENHGSPQSGYSVSGPRFKPGTSRGDSYYHFVTLDYVLLLVWITFIISELLMAMRINITVFWDMTPFSLLDGRRRLLHSIRIALQGYTASHTKRQ
jgi:hypothetical protein